MYKVSPNGAVVNLNELKYKVLAGELMAQLINDHWSLLWSQ